MHEVQPTAEKRQHEATGERNRNGLLLLDAEYRTKLPAAEKRQRVERSDQTARSKRRRSVTKRWRTDETCCRCLSMRNRRPAAEWDEAIKKQNQTAWSCFGGVEEIGTQQRRGISGRDRSDQTAQSNPLMPADVRCRMDGGMRGCVDL